MTTTAPFGTWLSPISAADTIAGLIGFSDIAVDGDDLYWIELRPSERGRQVLVRRSGDGSITDMTPPPVDVRTRVHEYGGAPYAVRGGRIVYSDGTTQRLHGCPSLDPVTPEPPRPMSVRFADGRFLPDGRLVCVRETHPEEGEAVNELVVVDPADGSQVVLASGRDFYAAPRPTPDGSRLAWLEWDHPNMPWDGTELLVADLDEGRLGPPRSVAGGLEESVFQPEWAPDGTLWFSTDRSGWWNVARRRHDGDVEAVFTVDADCGEPAWVFGRTTFGFLSDGRAVIGCWQDGGHRLVVLDPDGSHRTLDTPFSNHAGPITDGGSTVWFVGYRPDAPTALVELDVDSTTWTEIRSNPMPVDRAALSVPEVISYPTIDGATAHAVFYPPANPAFRAPDGERPPLIVEVHGGPTSHVFPRLSAGFLYWTTRGFGVVDVNYRGSTGFGRAYRQALEGAWGIVDVGDCLDAARALADRGLADGDRLLITGGSAGGYTTLAALAFGDAFAAGASHFGVADVELLARHTHKFESRYLDRLVGTDPEEMRRRSPLYSADRISVPVVLFQGLEDRVVPPEQAEMIARALEDNGIPCALLTYEGEDHGFRKAENIIHTLETELAFYGRVLGFRPAGDLPDVPLRGGAPD